jgi:hypothetical protein
LNLYFDFDIASCLNCFTYRSEKDDSVAELVLDFKVGHILDLLAAAYNLSLFVNDFKGLFDLY